MKEIVIKSNWSCTAIIFLVVYGNESNHFYTSFVTQKGAEKYAEFLRRKYKFVEVSELNLFNE